MRGLLILFALLLGCATAKSTGTGPTPTQVKIEKNGTARLPIVANTGVVIDYQNRVVTLKNGLERPIGVRISQINTRTNMSPLVIYEETFIDAGQAISKQDLDVRQNASYILEVKVYRDDVTESTADLDNPELIELTDQRPIKIGS